MGSMAHDEPTGDGGGGGGGGRLSKRLKHNKVPQRGMGVAQLEKILEERQLKDAGVSTVSTPNSIRFRRLAVPLPPSLPPNRHPLISNPSIWPQFSSSMVNVSLGARATSSSSSSVMKIQIEPPLNQSYCANKYPSFQPDGDKMVGMKRSYPFLLENIPPAYVTKRENPSSLESVTDQKTKKFIDEKSDLAKDFLTLAPPQSSPPSHSRLKEKVQPLCVKELTRPSYQCQTGDTSETEWSNHQALHSFFPAAKGHGISNGEVGEHVDLNLKL